MIFQDARFLKGCELFDGAEFFEAHEEWEDLWHELHGPEHALVQGLIQVSVAMHHASNENWNGAKKLCSSAIQYLEKGKSAGGPVNLEELKDLVLDLVNAVNSNMVGNRVEIVAFKLPLKKD